ncbi:phosphotransferase [Alicyclobacillus dauci]|uniref:Phosphotransferase n=1 Tax=Alicyclobacillus dauci TaxID=1475485 RepID=A0ABY6Z154_9BACL|nr:phosphotransferase [Alicyclobacillus dauci]WAH36572.1 phosphotransferase [Alicyclobacillus dauci]
MAKRQRMPDWLELLYSEFTKPPYFLQKQFELKTASNKQSRTHDDDKNTEAHGSSGDRSTTLPTASGSPNDSAHSSKRKSVSNTSPYVKEAEVHRITGTNNARYGRAPSASRSLTMQIPQPVLERFPFQVERKEQLSGVLRVHTTDGKRYAVKRTQLAMPHVRFIHRALNFSQKQGFTRYSRFLLTAKKAPGLMYDGNVYYATEWVDGQPANFALAEHVAQTAYALAQFHEATRGFSSDKFTPSPVFDLFSMTQQRNRDLRQLLTRSEAKEDKDAFDTLFVSLKSQLQNDAAESLQLLQRSECVAFLQSDEAQPGICHLDVIPGNCLYGPDHHVHLIDFELSAFAPRALDIAHLLRRSLQLTNWNGDMAYACFLHFNAVKSMPKVEYQLVQALLKFPYRAWRLAHTRYHYFADGAQTTELQAYAQQEERRQHFLRSLSDQVQGLSIDNG